MKRRGFLLTALLVFLLLTTSAQAVEVRGIGAVPTLNFDGTTALCYVNCRGNTDKDTLDVTLTLYQGSTYLDSWSDSGVGNLSISGECEVQRGKTYTLTVTYSVSGVEKTPVTVTRTCG